MNYKKIGKKTVRKNSEIFIQKNISKNLIKMCENLGKPN